MKLHQIIAIICPLVYACTPASKLRETPPGCVKVQPNIWQDERPLTNMDYWEYLGWTMNHYGRFSPEFKAAFPDTSGHGHLVADALSEQDTNLQHKTYFVPKDRFEENLCCVSGPQLLQYARWRTEMVHWNRMRSQKLIAPDLAYSPHIFTRESMRHEKKLPEIFVYQLPRTTQWPKLARLNKPLKMDCSKHSITHFSQSYPSQ
jgi:hypothetical protein